MALRILAHMRENVDFKYIWNTNTEEYDIWLKTREAAKQLSIDLVTLNRDCKWATDERRGNLTNVLDCIRTEPSNQRGGRYWWVRIDIDDFYTMSLPGKGGTGDDPGWFMVRDLRRGPKPIPG